MVLEKTLESPLDSKEIKPGNPKGNQPWISIGRTDAEAEAPIFWPPDVKTRLIGKDPDAGKDWRQEKGTTEDVMAGWYHWLNGYEFEQAWGDSEGQGSLACCSPWGCKESNMTWQLYNNNMIETVIYYILSVIFSSIWQNSWLNWGASQANNWLQHSVISTQSNKDKVVFFGRENLHIFLLDLTFYLPLYLDTFLVKRTISIFQRAS